MIRYRCPYCDAVMESPSSAVGQAETCPECDGTCEVPAPPTGIRTTDVSTGAELRDTWLDELIDRERSSGAWGVSNPRVLRQTERWSGLAIGGFVMSILNLPIPGAVPPEDLADVLLALHFVSLMIALGLSLGGIAQIREGVRDRGLGLGRAGFVISCVGLVLFAVMSPSW